MASVGGPTPSLKRRDSCVTREGVQLIITPLGAGSEVGRSCVYMSYEGKTVLFDCGIHPAYSGMAALPSFDEIHPSTIDVLLVTHDSLVEQAVAGESTAKLFREKDEEGFRESKASQAWM